MRNVLLILVAATSVSYADHPKYTRKPDLKIDVTQSERVKPLQPAAATQKPVTPDDVMDHEEAIDPIRQEQEAMLIQLITDTPDTDPDKPDYMFRLAEHYAWQLKLWNLRAVEHDLGPRRTHHAR
jgi:hypothetical protein